MDFEDRLISLLPNIEVHIIPGATARRDYKKPRRTIQKGKIDFSWSDCAKTAAFLVEATLVSLGLRMVGIGTRISL
jgi:two-component system sensor histidine kinase KdpD